MGLRVDTEFAKATVHLLDTMELGVMVCKTGMESRPMGMVVSTVIEYAECLHVNSVLKL